MAPPGTSRVPAPYLHRVPRGVRYGPARPTVPLSAVPKSSECWRRAGDLEETGPPVSWRPGGFPEETQKEGANVPREGAGSRDPHPHSQGALCRRWDAPRCPRSGLVWGLRMLTSAGTAGCPPHPTEGQSRGQTWGGEQSTPQSTSAPPQQGFLPGAHTADPRGAEAPAHTQQRAATMGPHPHAVPPRCPCPIPGGATHPPLTQSQNIGRAAINNPARHKAISVPPAGGMRAREKALK